MISSALVESNKSCSVSVCFLKGFLFVSVFLQMNYEPWWRFSSWGQIRERICFLQPSFAILHIGQLLLLYIVPHSLTSLFVINDYEICYQSKIDIYWCHEVTSNISQESTISLVLALDNPPSDCKVTNSIIMAKFLLFVLVLGIVFSWKNVEGGLLQAHRHFAEVHFTYFYIKAVK